jgi:Bifunctional DNA primase/polymerase, N-terminal/AAA domain
VLSLVSSDPVTGRMDQADGRPGPSDPHTAAKAYASLGWRVVPIAPGQKRPTLPNWSQAATDDLAVIDSWWTGLYRGHGVGIATGPDTGIWVLDVDVADGKTGAESLAGLQEEHGRLPRTVTAVTGSGGLHLLFAWNPDQPVTNGDAARLGPGLDIRGAGGQIVVAPTVHPNGEPYRWQDGRDPWTLEPAPAPGWLYELLHPTPIASPAGDGVPLTALQPATTGSSDDSIADWVRARYRWEDALEADGWTIHHHAGDETHWTRPGKDRRDGSSAVLHGPDGPLVIFTTGIPPALAAVGTPTVDGGAVTVSLFDYLAGTRHGGDRQALARAARSERLRLEPPPPVQSAVEAGLLAPAPAPEPMGFVDLDHWWDRSEPERQADVLTRTDGTALLYTGDLNWIYGDSGSGKTWVALAAAVQLLADGGHVAWIHYEDPTPATIIGRLKALGVPRDTAVAQFHYYDPQGAPIDWAALADLCSTIGVTWATLDSVGEALNAAGVNEDSDTEVGPWLNNGPRALVNAGIGFVGVDHGTKAQNQKLHPSGSKRKRAAVTGAALLIEPIVSPTVDRDGMLRITCAKDRHGNHQQGSTVGIAHLRHDITTGGLNVTINDDSTSGQDDSHNTRVRAVVRAVTENPGLSKRQLLRFLPTAGTEKRLEAIDEAIELGVIQMKSGPRNAQLLYPIDAELSDDP